MSDPTTLKRIHALLDKAASTTFPAESEALVAKAQELMTRHAIDEAILAAPGRGRTRDRVVARTHVVESPYASAKSALLSAVLRPNGCRVVFHGGGRGPRTCTVVGHSADLDQALVLYHGLVLHGVREMLRAPVPEWEGVRSFRHAFLLAFAARIGERLKTAAAAAAADASIPATGRSVAVVLADRGALVDQELGRLFPHLTTARRSASSGVGYASGRAAADRAGLGERAIRSTPSLTQ
jgi:hypothetical protein